MSTTIESNDPLREDLRTAEPSDSQGEQAAADLQHIPYASPTTQTGPPYRLLKDGFIWLSAFVICAIATACSYPYLKKSGPEGAGQVTGTFIGLMFLSGFVGLPLARCVRRFQRWIPRSLFVLVAFSVCSLSVLGRWVETRTTAQANLAQTARLFANDLHLANTGLTPVNLHRMSAAQADDLRVALDMSRSGFRDGTQISDRFQAQVKKIVGDGILLPSQLDSPDHIAAARVKVKQVRDLIASHRIDAQAYHDKRIKQLDDATVSEGFRRTTLASLRTEIDKQLQISKQVTQLDEDVANVSEQIIAYVEARLGQLQFKPDSIQFPTTGEADGYNQLLAKLQDDIAQEQKLNAAGQASVQATLATFQKAFSGR